MTSMQLAKVIWTLAVGMVLIASMRARNARHFETVGHSVRILSAPDPASKSGAIAVDEVILSADNLFRIGRANAEPATETAVAASPQPPKAVTRPALVLRGILGGPPWEAILEGMPGVETGVVARAGEVIGGLTVRSIGRDTAIIHASDTSWVLTVRGTP